MGLGDKEDEDKKISMGKRATNTFTTSISKGHALGGRFSFQVKTSVASNDNREKVNLHKRELIHSVAKARGTSSIAGYLLEWLCGEGSLLLRGRRKKEELMSSETLGPTKETLLDLIVTLSSGQRHYYT